MREITFRAWHKPTSKMYWFDLTWGNRGYGNGYIGMVACGEERDKPGKYCGNVVLIDPDDCDIMQHAGYKDWYEGDIIKCRQGEQQKPDGEGEYIGFVRFDKGAFYIDFKCAIISTVYLHDIDGRGEVSKRTGGYNLIKEFYLVAQNFECIGNIYENPELKLTRLPLTA